MPDPQQQVATGSTMSGNPSTAPANPSDPPLPQGYSASDVVDGPPMSAGVDTSQPAPPPALPPGYSASDIVDGPPTPETSTTKPGMLSRIGEVTGVSGMVDLGKQAIQYGQKNAQTFGQARPIDALTDAISDMRNGDWKQATEKADKLVRVLSGFDPDNPLIEAAKQIVKHSITEAAAAARQQREGSTTDQALSALDPSGAIRSIKEGLETASKDYNSGNTMGAVGDVVTAPLQSHEVGSIPMIGGAIQQFGESTDQDLHDHNYSALIGDVLGAVGAVFGPHLVGKAGSAFKAAALDTPVADAAGTMSRINSAAKKASADPLAKVKTIAETTKADIDDTFDQAQKKIDAEKEADTQQASTTKTDAIGQADKEWEASRADAKTTHDNANQATRDYKQDAVTEADNAALDRKEAAKAKLDASNKLVDDTLTKANDAAHANLLKNLTAVSADAVEPASLAKTVSDAIAKYKDTASEAYEDAINGENGLATQLKGEKSPGKGSQRQTTAQERLNAPVPDDDYETKTLKGISGNKLSSDVKDYLTDVSNGAETVTKAKGTEPAVTKPLPDKTIDDLVRSRQAARKAAYEGYLSGDPNAVALREMVKAYDADIETMAKGSGKPELIDKFNQAKTKYFNDRRLLESDTAESLKLNNEPDKAIDDASKFFVSGPNASGKIAAIRSIGGDDMMNSIAKTRIAEMRRLAETDPKSFSKQWEALAKQPGLRENFFGPDLTNQLDGINVTYKTALKYAKDKAAQMKEAAVGKNAITGRLNNTLRKADSQTISNTEFQRNQDAAATHEAANADIAKSDAFKRQTITDNYSAAIKAIAKNAETQLDAARDTKAIASKPYNGFIRNMIEGRVNKELTTGSIDAQDVRNVKAIAGSHWDDAAKGIFDKALQDASPNGRFNPDALLKWWDKIEPDVREEMFSNHDAATLRSYNDFIDEIKKTTPAQELIKRGAMTASTAGISAGAAALGVHYLGPIGELVGTALGLKYGGSIAKSIVEKAATHPTAWRVASKLSKGTSAVQSGVGKGLSGAATVGQYAPLANQPSSRRSVYDSAASALSGTRQ